MLYVSVDVRFGVGDDVKCSRIVAHESKRSPPAHRLMITPTGNTIKAWRSNGRGADDVVLETVEIPTPGIGTALIQVVHSALNFSDVLMLEDLYQVRPPRPFIPGQEVAGVVVEAGPESRLTPGDRVASKVEWGAFAPWAVVRDDMAIVLDKTTDLAAWSERSH